MQRMKAGKRTCEQLLLVFKERAIMEEEYGKRLARLAKSFKVIQDVGPDMGGSLDEEVELSGYVCLLKLNKDWVLK